MSGAPARNQSIDCLRGAVMVLMALDHTRMFLGPGVDLATAPPALYFTRWVTHFCAPVFVLLAGTAAFLHGQRLRSTRALARFLLTRGLWLVLLELTVVRVAWIGDLGVQTLVLQVIWAIGASMIVLAGLVWLPLPAIATFAAVLILGHDALDGIHAEAFGNFRWLWVLLHEESRLQPFPGASWLVVYPLVPWAGVMAAGYAVVGPWAARPAAQRRARFARAGVALMAGFLLLRASNLYGDPHPWTTGASPVRTLLSFLDCAKYPPSLLFLAMTLGPALCVLAWMDRPRGPWAARIAVFGRVPLFYYVLHLALIHLLAIALAWPSMGTTALTHRFIAGGSLGYGLPAVYAFWAIVVLALYPACVWFAGVKRRSDAVWLSYL